MIDFLLYNTSVFSALSNNTTPILTSTLNTLYVNSISICNTSSNSITINLTKTIISATNQTVFLIKDLEIPSSRGVNLSTVNLVKLYNLEIFLPVTSVNNQIVTAALNTYSGGINQNFDCVVDYSVLTELPNVTLQNVNYLN